MVRVDVGEQEHVVLYLHTYINTFFLKLLMPSLLSLYIYIYVFVHVFVFDNRFRRGQQYPTLLRHLVDDLH